MAQDVSKYKDIFLGEATQHLATMNQALLGLEKTPGNAELITRLLRALHTLKGMAATMEYEQAERLCHAMEDALETVRKKQLRVEACADRLFASFDRLEATLNALRKGQGELDTTALVEQLRVLATQAGPRGPKDDATASPVVSRDDEPATPPGPLIEKIQRIDVKVERLDTLMNLAEELLITKMRLERIKETLRDPELSVAMDALGRLVSELQYNVMQARLVPIGFVFDRFPRMVRDLARQQRKDVTVRIEGAELELDRVVLDEIGEGLVHLLRNAVDHGIETPEERRKSGKPPQGTIQLIATRTKEFAVIQVADDGGGLDLEAIKAAAVKRGLLESGAAKEELTEAIFAGLSTTKQVTAVSGRGLGLNIVKKKVESLGGTLRVSSQRGSGTTFVMELPFSLAVIKTLFVEVGGSQYAIPVASIERLVTVSRTDIKGFLEYEAVVLGEIDIPLTRLGDLFGVPRRELAQQPVVIVRKGEELLALAVDTLLSTQEIVIKPLSGLVSESRYFAGSTIVGSGEVVLILNVGNLILSKRQETTYAGVAR